MSALASILKTMVERVPGALGAVFADGDGEAVDEFALIAALEIKLVGAHFGVVLELFRAGLFRRGLGAVEEMLVETENLTILVHQVTDGYYVLLAAQATAPLG